MDADACCVGFVVMQRRFLFVCFFSNTILTSCSARCLMARYFLWYRRKISCKSIDEPRFTTVTRPTTSFCRNVTTRFMLVSELCFAITLFFLFSRTREFVTRNHLNTFERRLWCCVVAEQRAAGSLEWCKTRRNPAGKCDVYWGVCACE